MSFKKKKNVIVVTFCIVTCYIIYQLYFFLTLTSEANNALSPVLDLDGINNLQHLKSEDDKYINDHGIIRGVYFADMKEYRPDHNKEFKCRKSSKKIAFEHVNDDFCDCEDGTDEPSTSACPDSLFYCDTQFPRRQSFSVPSNKVNDGICDCCDGSDEWLHGSNKILSQNTPNNRRFYLTKCPNNCHK